MGEHGKSVAKKTVFVAVWLASGLAGIAAGVMVPDRDMAGMSVFVYGFLGLVVGPLFGILAIDTMKRHDEAARRSKNPYLRT